MSLLRKTSGFATRTYDYTLQRLSVEYVNEAKEYYLYNGTGNVTQTTAENGSMFLRYTSNGEDYDHNTIVKTTVQ